MTEKIIVFLENNPYVLYIALVFLFVILLLFVIGVLQGREVTIYPPKIGPKVKKSDQTPNTSSSSSSLQANLQTPVKQTQNQTVYVQTTFSSKQIEEIAIRVAEKIPTLYIEKENKLATAIYQPPDLSDRLEYLYASLHEIEKKIRLLVLSDGGGWAGASMAGFDTYLNYAQMGNIISEELAGEITDLYSMWVNPLKFGDDIPDESFSEIQYLITDINRKLDAILLSQGTQ